MNRFLASYIRRLVGGNSLELGRICCFCICFLCAAWVSAENTITHRVRPGETIYSITRRYNVTAEAIRAINPGVVGNHVVAGMEIVIPVEVSSEEATSAPEETAPASTPVADPIVIIDSESAKAVEEDANEKILSVKDLPQVSTIAWPHLDKAINLGVILPFNLEAKNEAEQGIQLRAVEFYQGLLLAVDDAQRAGSNVSLQVYDCGSKALSQILQTPSLKDCDLIIAPLDLRQVRLVADFGNRHGINVVSPFTFDLKLSEQFSHLFQLNTAKSLLYKPVVSDVMERFASHTIIFLTDSTEMEKKEVFVDHLQAELDSREIEYYEYGYSDAADVGVIDSVLQLEGDVLYIPYTANKSALSRIFPYLQSVQVAKGDTIRTSMLGYPEWQLYMEDFMDYYYALDVHMFTKIYVNPFDEGVKSFYNRFKSWYGKDPMQIYPKYAILGFDIGTYFLTALSRYGKGFEVFVEELATLPTLQNTMYYRPLGLGQGYINRGLYMVRFSPQITIEKTVIR